MTTTVQETSKATADVAEAVRKEGGLVSLTLGDLRNQMGYSRLGKHVLSAMEAHLTENGLSFFPLEVLDPIVNSEPRQWQTIQVFLDDDSPESAVFRAFADPDSYSLVDAIRNLVASAPKGDRTNYKSWSQKRKLEEISRIVAA